MRPPETGPATRPARILWGLPDALLCWLAGYLGAILASFPFYLGTDEGAKIKTALVFGIILPAQQLTAVLAVVYVSRLKGQRSLGADFGFRIRILDAKVVFVGAALSFLLSVALYPLLRLDPKAEHQQLLTDLEDNFDVVTGVLFFFGAVVFAPMVEELLFRGILLRALLRKFTPPTAILVSSAVFALVHFIGDPNTVPFLPALAALGAVLAVVTLRTGNLSQAIWIHAGFNATTTFWFLWSKVWS